MNFNKITIKTLSEEHFEQALSFHQKAIDEIGEIFYYKVSDEVTLSALQQATSLGAFDENTLVGMRLSYISLIPNDFLIHMPITESNSIGGYLAGVYILPFYRKMGLSKMMTKSLLNSLKTKGVKHIYTTVHPKNFINIRSLTSCGFKMVYEGIFYGDKPRVLFHKCR